MHLVRQIAWLAVAMTTFGCATYRDELGRGRAAFELNEHDRALGILRGLENDLPHLSHAEQTQYFYLRGLTDYRIGYRSDARHWLALAQASDRKYPGALPEAWRARMEEALVTLHADVYARGYEAFTNEKRPAEGDSDAASAAPGAPGAP